MKKVFMLSIIACFLMALEIGTIPKRVVLEKDKGGTIDGSPFDTASMKGKVYLVIYSDPDKRDLNEPFFEKVKAKNFDRNRYTSIAIINMAATWIPNFLLNAILKAKQKKYPYTVYVKDNKKVLVHAWQLPDNDQVVMIFDQNGRVQYIGHGKLSQKEQERALHILEELINESH
ncbi:YtfJ family protein [Nitratiruptor sp. SB155-2]|uniref:YtfJ family protein n=1 Tax=Nitratiruptor sp. (strain SB155-2) TaxID=387092 RepID=UPI0001586F98|nr:YtfJ family protein [Nitratiruptor sp. SB155-2]BAF69621.1 transcriptional regulator [Nitratiruptor sp. SB155-2]